MINQQEVHQEMTEYEDCNGCRRNDEKEDDHAMDSTFISYHDPPYDSFFNDNNNGLDMLDDEGFEIFQFGNN